jgi:ABC-type transporter Mla subunit MlaD
MSDVDLIINVHTNGVKDITNLSAATRALALNLRGITVPMAKLDSHSRAVNKALGLTNRSMNDHAKTVKQLVANQKSLGAETKRIQSNIKSYAMAIQSAGGTTTAFGRELIQSRS